jgi:hypothetical protein
MKRSAFAGRFFFNRRTGWVCDAGPTRWVHLGAILLHRRIDNKQLRRNARGNFLEGNVIAKTDCVARACNNPEKCRDADIMQTELVNAADNFET